MSNKTLLNNTLFANNLSNNINNNFTNNNANNNIFKDENIKIFIYLSVAILVLLQTSVAIISKLFKPINCYIKSYHRLLTNMISECIYELQFFQNIANFYYLSIEFKPDTKKIFEILKSFIFIDVFKPLPGELDKNKLPKKFREDFNDSFTTNEYTFIIFLFLGLIIVLILKIIEKLRDKIENEQNIKNSSNFRDKKFQKFTLESLKNYMLYNYFLRLYQITVCKTSFVCLLIINNPNLAIDNKYEIIISYLVLIIWVIGFPSILFVFLRKKQNDLMSPDLVIKYGTLYLNFRGISKDVYAILMQLKLCVLPIICIYLNKFPFIQLILLIMLFLYGIIFITISMPFCKANKVFTESLSEGLLMAFFIVLLVDNKFKISDIIKDDIIGYICIGIFLTLIFIRLYRNIYDSIFKIINILEFKVKNKSDIENIELKNKIIEIDNQNISNFGEKSSQRPLKSPRPISEKVILQNDKIENKTTLSKNEVITDFKNPNDNKKNTTEHKPGGKKANKFFKENPVHNNITDKSLVSKKIIKYNHKKIDTSIINNTQRQEEVKNNKFFEKAINRDKHNNSIYTEESKDIDIQSEQGNNPDFHTVICNSNNNYPKFSEKVILKQDIGN